MSALGQKQALAVQQGVSALPPKRTCAVQLGMSALCQERTFANDYANRKIALRRSLRNPIRWNSARADRQAGARPESEVRLLLARGDL
jgi:hypothetical protein